MFVLKAKHIILDMFKFRLINRTAILIAIFTLLLNTAEGYGNDFDEFEDEFVVEAGGTSVPSPVFDPLAGYNRFVFSVNDKAYSWIVEPVARSYAFIVPESPRIAIHRFFANLRFPIRLVNNVLQGDFQDAAAEATRFGLNTTVGILGFFDPAAVSYGIHAREEDFGQTLGRFGVGDGVPLVLPLLGPSNLRDAFGKIPDYFLDPGTYIQPGTVRASVRICELENGTSLKLGEYEDLKEASLDPYTFFRDAYKQNRDERIKR